MPTLLETPSASRDIVRDGVILGTVYRQRDMDLWYGSPRHANTGSFLSSADAEAYILRCADAAPQRFVRVSQQEHYAHGCAHIGHRVGAPLHVRLGQCAQRQPLVTIQELIGAGDYRPAELRAIASKLIAVAEDAEKQPMGPRSFFDSYRRY